MLKIEGLTCKLWWNKSSQGIDMEVPEGKIISLLEQMGAGKSHNFALSLLATKITSGKI
jgi:ABC-type uncharacterized transport system ATPase subunit